jgi:hypothetical protein
MSAPEYTQFGTMAWRYSLVEPFALLVPKKGDLFVDRYLAAPHTHTCDVPQLARALLEAEESASRSQLVPLLGHCTERQLAKLNRLVATATSIPDSFRDAVAPPPEERLDEQPQGFLSRLRGRAVSNQDCRKSTALSLERLVVADRLKVVTVNSGFDMVLSWKRPTAWWSVCLYAVTRDGPADWAVEHLPDYHEGGPPDGHAQWAIGPCHMKSNERCWSA